MNITLAHVFASQYAQEIKDASMGDSPKTNFSRKPRRTRRFLGLIKR